MGQRIAYGTLFIVVLVMLFELDVFIATKAEALDGALGDLLRRGSVLPLFFLVVIVRGAVELNRLLRAGAARPHVFFAYLMIALLLLTPWLSAAGWLGTGPVEVEGLFWQIVWLLVTGIGAGVLVVMRRDPEGTFRDMGATLIMVFYLGFLASFGLQLRCGRDVPAQEGAWLLLIAVLVTKASDIGAYFVGSAIGRHKLVPRISPAKSIEGTVGGLIAGAVVAMLFASAGGLAARMDLSPQLCAMIEEVTRSFSNEHHPEGISPLWRAVFFGFAMSAAGQFGDLIESCFKRDARIKDSGKVMPHYGGILDMIDSPVVAMPVAWFLLTVVWNVV
ncbi:MAG: phosphatidate cytidylyltransferase [Phycisphaerae bacterium]